MVVGTDRVMVMVMVSWGVGTDRVGGDGELGVGGAGWWWGRTG